MENNCNGKMVSKMGRIASFFFGIVFLLSILTCTKNRQSFFYKESFQLKESNNSVFVKNDLNKPISFQLEVNNIFPLNMDDFQSIVREIKDSTGSSMQEAAWRYILQSTFHNQPPNSNNWIHHPTLFLNSIGGGLCDDLASNLAFLWIKNGDSARIINLNGHVVPEVQIDNEWHMYDPDLGLSICDADTKIYSINDIIENPTSLSTIEAICKPNLLKHPLLLSNTKFSQQIASIYTSTDDNIDVSEWMLNCSSSVDSFTLPSNSSLIIQYNFNKKVVSFSVLLSEKSKGELYLPLMPFSYSGEFDIDTKKGAVTLVGEDEKLPKEYNKLTIDIVAVHKESYIHYAINPKVFPFDSLLTLTIHSQDSVTVYQDKFKSLPLYPIRKALMIDSIKQYSVKNNIEFQQFTRLDSFSYFNFTEDAN